MCNLQQFSYSIKEFDKEIYDSRNLVETMFSFLRRKYLEEIKSRKYRNQVKEVKCTMPLQNIERYNSFTIIIHIRISTEPLEY